MDAKMYNDFIHLQKEHWWFIHRNNVVLDIINSLAIYNKKILIAGCGMGADFELVDREKNHVFGIDNSSVAIEFCKNNYKNITLINSDLQDIKETNFDFILLLDVLEHIENEKVTLEKLYASLNDKGFLLLTVPAFQCLWSTHDDINHHLRRYTKKELISKLNNANFKINKIIFFNSLLLPLIYLFRKAKNIVIKKPKSDFVFFDIKFINKFLIWFLKIERVLLKKKSFPFGSSLLCLAEKNNK